ncbi:ribosomal protein S18-alanine N-acetyltransferase [soil metagenome]
MLDLKSGGVVELPVVDRIMRAAFDPRFGEAWTPSQCMGILSMPGVWLTIAWDREEALGFALAREIAGEAELLLLATLPVHRKRGVAGALLRSVMDDARTRGAKTVHLEVRAGNDAVRLYRTAGFVKVGERRNYYRGSANQLCDAHTYASELG